MVLCLHSYRHKENILINLWEIIINNLLTLEEISNLSRLNHMKINRTKRNTILRKYTDYINQCYI